MGWGASHRYGHTRSLVESGEVAEHPARHVFGLMGLVNDEHFEPVAEDSELVFLGVGGIFPELVSVSVDLMGKQRRERGIRLYRLRKDVGERKRRLRQRNQLTVWLAMIMVLSRCSPCQNTSRSYTSPDWAVEAYCKMV